MIEIFRTNITRQKDADKILIKIHSGFPGFEANFDLTDCDHILRIKSIHTPICHRTFIGLVKDLGFQIEVLPDIVPAVHHPDESEERIQI